MIDQNSIYIITCVPDSLKEKWKFCRRKVLYQGAGTMTVSDPLFWFTVFRPFRLSAQWLWAWIRHFWRIL